MVRNPLKKSEKEETSKKTEAKDELGVQVIERSINLALINDKLNYIMGSIQKIAEACEVDLSKE